MDSGNSNVAKAASLEHVHAMGKETASTPGMQRGFLYLSDVNILKMQI